MNSPVLHDDAFFSEVISVGYPIPSKYSNISFNNEVVELKCNSVCYMKNEGKNIKNTLATNQKYICYSVKGNLIRVIKEKTSDKLLLRGHENTISDMKFSVIDQDILCSIDNGTHGNNIFIWKLLKETEFTSETICTLPLPATLLQSHPLASTIWAVANQSSICLISSIHHNNSSNNQRLSYDNFSCHWNFHGKIIDFSFSLDGRLIVVATQSEKFSLHTLLLPYNTVGINEIELGHGNFQLHSSIDVNYPISGLSFIPSDPLGSTWNLLTLKSEEEPLNDQNFTKETKATLQLWNIKEKSSPSVSQTVVCHLPYHPKHDSTLTTSQLSFERSNGHYVIVSDRRSNIIACIAITSDFTSYNPERILYHCTYLDLKLPVSGLLCDMVLVQEGANFGQVQHIAVTCFQDQLTGQLAVQQYFIQSRTVYPIIPIYINDDENNNNDNNDNDSNDNDNDDDDSDDNNNNKIEKSESFSPINLLNNIDALVNSENNSTNLLSPSGLEDSFPQSTVSPTAATGGKAGISFLSKSPTSLPPGSFPDFAIVSNIDLSSNNNANNANNNKNNGSTNGNNSNKSTPNSSKNSLPQESVDIGLKSKGILLNALKIHPVENLSNQTITSTSSTTSSSSVPSSTILVSTIEPSTKSQTNNTNSNNNTNNSSFSNITIHNITSNSSSSNSNSSSKNISQSNSNSSFAPVSKKIDTLSTPLNSTQSNESSSGTKMRKIPFDLTKLMATNSSPSPSTTEPPVSSIKEINSVENQKEEDEWEKASLTISRSLLPSQDRDNTNEQKDSIKENELNDNKSIVFNQSQINILEEQQEILKSLTQQMNLMQTTIQTLSNEKKSKKGSGAEVTTKHLAELKTNIISEVMKGVEKFIQSAIEEQSSQAVAKILGSDQWREELSTQISADLRTELAPFITQTTKDSIRDSIRDNLKPALVKSFKTAFETTIIPAYQSGTENMFQQLQQTFESGMNNLAEDSRTIQSNTTSDTLALRNEVEELKTTILQLKSQIQDLSTKQQISIDKQTSAIASLMSSSKNSTAQLELNYTTLYEEGRVVESLELALESKNVTSVIWVLSQVQQSTGTIASLVEKCSEKPLLLLCTIQQLVVDLSKNKPSEGLSTRLEWLKELLISLVGLHDHLNRSILVQGRTLESIISDIHNLMREAEKFHQIALASSSSQRTDMKMLSSVLASSF